MAIEDIGSILEDKRAKFVIRKAIVFTAVLISIMFAWSVIAAHVIRTSSGATSYSINEDVGFVYNISVNISDSGQNANVTQVNITLPGSFTFVSAGNGTSTIGDFSYSSQVLSWSNFTYYLINGSAGDVLNYFWFNATASTPGNYNISVMTLNGTGVYYSNISVTVNDTTSPTVSINSPSSGDFIKASELPLNFTVTLSENGSAMYSLNTGANNFSMRNSSGGAIGLVLNATNGSIADGTYTIQIYANDSAGNQNNTVSTSFTYDSTNPVVTLISPADDTSSTTSSYDFTYNVTDANSVDCILVVDDENVGSDSSENNTGGDNSITESSSISTAGSYIWSVNCTDAAGNVGTSDEWTLVVESASDDDDDGGSGGSGGSSSEWDNSYSYSDVDFSQKQPLTRSFQDDYRVTFKLGGSTHYMGITSLTATSATIKVASTPQTATLAIGESKKFEVTDDNFYDVLVKLNSITGTSASMTISYIHEAMPAGGTNSTNQTDSENLEENAANNLQEGEAVTTPDQEARIKIATVAFVIVGVIAIVIVGFYIYRRNKRGY